MENCPGLAHTKCNSYRRNWILAWGAEERAGVASHPCQLSVPVWVTILCPEFFLYPLSEGVSSFGNLLFSVLCQQVCNTSDSPLGGRVGEEVYISNWRRFESRLNLTTKKAGEKINLVKCLSRWELKPKWYKPPNGLSKIDKWAPPPSIQSTDLVFYHVLSQRSVRPLFFIHVSNKFTDVALFKSVCLFLHTSKFKNKWGSFDLD